MPEADALLAQAKHLRDQAEIQERQLNKLRAGGQAAASREANNILPLERLKAWSRAVSFSRHDESHRPTPTQAHAPLLRGQQGRISRLDEVPGGRPPRSTAPRPAGGCTKIPTPRPPALKFRVLVHPGRKDVSPENQGHAAFEVEKLLKVEQDAFEMIDKLRKKLAEAEQALADAKNPLDMIPRALARSMAHDELDMAYVVQKSCVAQAEPIKAGHFVDLDGRSYFISNRGEVAEDQGGALGTSRRT